MHVKITELTNFEQIVVELDTLLNLHENQMGARRLQRETTSLESQQGEISLQKSYCPMDLLSLLNCVKHHDVLKKPLTQS